MGDRQPRPRTTSPRSTSPSPRGSPTPRGSLAALEPLYAQLTADGVFVAAAAGNQYATGGNSDGLSVLADGPAAAVGSTTFDASTGIDQLAAFSQRGDGLSLLAPGVNVLGLGVGGLAEWSGTSISTPFVAAAAVLIREALDRLGLASTPASILDLLRRTGVPVADPATGAVYSRIDVAAALAAVGMLASSPIASPAAPIDPATATVVATTPVAAAPPTPARSSDQCASSSNVPSRPRGYRIRRVGR